jgi:hypothetical protein
LRIELPLGSYMVEFHRSPIEAPAPRASPIDTGMQSLPSKAAALRWNRNWVRAGVGVILAAVLFVGGWLWEGRASAIRQFWKPATASKAPTLVCLNTWDISSLVKTSTSPLAAGISSAGLDPSQWLPINDAVAFSQITGFLGELQSNYHIQGARSTTLSDLMQGPVVLIGIFGNPWTQRVTDPLRFRFIRGDVSGPSYIVDRKDPSKRYSIVDGAGTSSRDFAIVGRVFNPATGQVCFIVAGLNAAGTTAASEFVTSPRYMEYLKSVLPTMSDSKSLEAVISVEVIDGRPGAPHIEAAEAW